MFSSGEKVSGASTDRSWPYSGSSLPSEAETNIWNSLCSSGCLTTAAGTAGSGGAIMATEGLPGSGDEVSKIVCAHTGMDRDARKNAKAGSRLHPVVAILAIGLLIHTLLNDSSFAPTGAAALMHATTYSRKPCSAGYALNAHPKEGGHAQVRSPQQAWSAPL